MSVLLSQVLTGFQQMKLQEQNRQPTRLLVQFSGIILFRAHPVTDLHILAVEYVSYVTFNLHFHALLYPKLVTGTNIQVVDPWVGPHRVQYHHLVFRE